MSWTFLLFWLLIVVSVRSEEDFFQGLSYLRSKLKGYVFYRGSPDYETARAVHNGACRNIFPLMIIKPLNSRDVSVAVKFAVKNHLEISVRSGGHSYQCLGTKSNSLHIDLRALNHVDFYEKHGLVRIGAGAIIQNVLDVVPPEKYTFIHGNARNVGVGGYLTGVGVNPIGTTHRHGYGADNVVEYKMILADGSIAIVNGFNTTIIERNGKRVEEVYSHQKVPDLRYAIRGAGPSYGIVTEFLYKVYPHPETLSLVLLVYIENSQDLQRLVKAGQDGRYGITVMTPRVFRRPKPAAWLAWILIKAPGFFQWQSGRKVPPVTVSVVDLQSNTGHTPAGPAIAFLKQFGIKLAVESISLIERFGLDRINLSVQDQESVYLTKDELEAEGYHGMASVNANGIYSYKMIERAFLHHPTYGIHSPRGLSDNSDCDFCLWILYIGKEGVNDNVIADTKIGPLSFELACTYNAGDPRKAKNCPRAMGKIKKLVNEDAKKVKEQPRQYVNTPSCFNDDFFPFYERYWGNSYRDLLKAKKFWDPTNVFNYCHSVGSSEENCCAV